MFLLLEVEQLDLPDPLKVVGEQRIQGADRVPKQACRAWALTSPRTANSPSWRAHFW